MNVKWDGKITSGTINNIGTKYILDENKFSDWLKFCELYPDKDFLQFREYCRAKGGGEKID